MIMLEKVKKIIVITCMISLSLIGSLANGMTSYAKGPGEANTTKTASTQINITTYNKSVIAGLGSWVQESNLWRFKLNAGGYAVSSWIESLSEAGVFYYVDESGIMLTNTTTPDGYTVDANGAWRGIVVINSNGNKTKSNNSPIGNKGNNSNSGEMSNDERQRLLDFMEENNMGEVSKYDRLD